MIPAETMTDADYADNLAHIAHTPAQSASLLHSLEHTGGYIWLGNDN